MNKLEALFVSAVMLSLLVGCGDSSTKPDDNQQTTALMYFDEPKVLEKSGPITAALHGSYLEFDLDTIPIAANRTLTDISINYYKSSTCDEDIWAFNWSDSTWDQFSFQGDYGCAQMEGWDVTLFSNTGLRAKEYISDNGILRLNSLALLYHAGNQQRFPKATLIRYDPRFKSMQLLLPINTYPRQLTTDGANYWIVLDYYESFQMLLKLAADGSLINQRALGKREVSAIAYDGNELWLWAHGSDLLRMTPDGVMTCSLRLATTSAGALAFDNGELWAIEKTEHGKIMRFLPAPDCSSTLTTRTEWPNPLSGETYFAAFHRGRLLIETYTGLYRIDPSDLSWQRLCHGGMRSWGMSINGDTISVLHDFIAGAGTVKPAIARFLLRECTLP